MKKSDWYENRILWRARKLQLNSYMWRDFLLTKEQAAREILNLVDGYGVPLIIFWLNEDIWTLLTSQFLIGKLNDMLSSVGLDELGEVSTINENNLPPNELKRHAEFISAGEGRKIFWTPKGNPHFSLRNILGMFPINIP